MLLEILQSASFLSPFVAFLAGVATFFASCLLPLVPLYLTYLAGVSISTDTNKKLSPFSWKRVLNILRGKDLDETSVFPTAKIFVAGFITTFVLLGALANRVALIWGPYRELAQRLGGVFFILMGLFLLGIWKNNFLSQEWRLQFQNVFHPAKKWNAFLTGVVFAFGWTPCIGPILAVILFWSAQSETFLQGIFLLFFFGLGVGLPFLVVALLSEFALPELKHLGKAGNVLQRVIGGIIVLAGALLLTNQWKPISLMLLQIFNLRALSM